MEKIKPECNMCEKLASPEYEDACSDRGRGVDSGSVDNLGLFREKIRSMHWCIVQAPWEAAVTRSAARQQMLK